MGASFLPAITLAMNEIFDEVKSCLWITLSSVSKNRDSETNFPDTPY